MNLQGFQPADLVAELRSELPRRALFTTFTFSPGTFHQKYVAPLVQRGCGEIAVLADRTGYAQSLFAAAAVQGIGSDYRLRQVSVAGAFHGKLALVRSASSMIVGVGSGNLTVSGLQTNAEVGGLYVVDQTAQLAQLDNLCHRLRQLARLEIEDGDAVSPILLAPDARLVTSLDEALIDQLNLPSDVSRIEIVSPFLDGQLEVLTTFRELWPNATIRVRLDPGFGSLNESLLAIDDEGIEILVPAEPKSKEEGARRPAVHGKLVCFLGGKEATIILGSANLSRPAFLTRENFEAVVERRAPALIVDKLLSVPHIRWRKAKSSDRRSMTCVGANLSFSPLIATLKLKTLKLSWPARATTEGNVRVWCRGRCVLERPLREVQEDGEYHTWISELTSEVEDSLRASSYAEIQLENDKRYIGWIDVEDRLGIPPEAKRQLALLDAIASDPLECKEKEVVKFIELLQRNLKASTRGHAFSASPPVKRDRDGYENTPIKRRLLLESGTTGSFGQTLILNQLLNRSLDSALRDLHFFARGSSEPGATKKSKSAGATWSDSPRDESGSRSLPPRIETVLNQLFAQLAEAFDSSGSARETARLIGQIPTCIKALAFASARWIARSQSQHLLYQYVHKVAVACLAPGVASVLRKQGAVRRIDAEERKEITGGPEFALGLSMLDAYLLFHFQNSSPESRRILRDMHDVLAELPTPDSSSVDAAGEQLLRIHSPASLSPANLDKARSELKQTIGEVAGLHDCRLALRKLISVSQEGGRTEAEMLLLAEKACGVRDPSSILEIVRSGGSHLHLIEIESDETACPECYRTFPSSVASRLSDTTHVWRCNCGVLIARSLDR